MAEVLVLVDHVDGEVKKVTLELLTAARALGEPSAVVVGPTGTAAKAKQSLAVARRRQGVCRRRRRRRELPGHAEGRRARRRWRSRRRPAAVLVTASGRARRWPPAWPCASAPA